MALETNDLFGKRDMVQISIDRIKNFEPMALMNNPRGYHVCISGGKDSSVIQELCIMSKVKCEFVNSHTSVDHPETVLFLRSEKARIEALGYDFTISIPRYRDGRQKTMWNLIEKKGFPSMFKRFCCSELKESSGYNRYIITGVRWEESIKRKKRGVNEIISKKVENKVVLNNDNAMQRKLTEICITKSEIVLNPIIDWTSSDVWDFIRSRNLPYNKLYDCGHSRVGCIGCPLVSHFKNELEKLPKYKEAYINAGSRYLEYRKARGLHTWGNNAQQQYDWWGTGSNTLFGYATLEFDD